MSVVRFPSRRAAIVTLVSGALALGCTSEEPEPQVVTIRQITEDLISENVADQAGLGPLAPTCPDVTVAGVGTEFECSATTESGAVVSLAALINNDGKVELSTTNVITVAALPSFERAAVEALNANDPTLGLSGDAMDCGIEPIVFPVEQSDGKTMVCGVVDPDTSEVFDVTFNITDIEERQFSVQVAEAPRS